MNFCKLSKTSIWEWNAFSRLFNQSAIYKKVQCRNYFCNKDCIMSPNLLSSRLFIEMWKVRRQLQLIRAEHSIWPCLVISYFFLPRCQLCVDENENQNKNEKKNTKTTLASFLCIWDHRHLTAANNYHSYMRWVVKEVGVKAQFKFLILIKTFWSMIIIFIKALKG